MHNINLWWFFLSINNITLVIYKYAKYIYVKEYPSESFAIVIVNP